MALPSVLLTGTSHVVSLRIAQASRRAREAATFHLADVELFPRFDPLFDAVDGQYVLNPQIEIELARVFAEVRPQLVVGSFWGNQHFFLSASNLPRRFDFVLPEAPDLPRDPLAELVPYDVVRAFIRLHFTLQGLMTDALRGLSAAPLHLMPAPPPVEDLSAIPTGSSSPQIDAMVAEHGAAPAGLRAKFWRLSASIQAELAAAAGVGTLAVPAQTVDEAGFRRPEYFSRDWIHANALYGELMLQQIDALVER